MTAIAPEADRPHHTVADRVERGRRARAQVPRSAHAELGAEAPGRDPLALLAAQDEGRVGELLPLRYARMAVSPFTFFRGSAVIMAADLADSPVSGLTVQLCGDAHLSNFGFFGSPERRLVFDVNDFDETLPGPWEWDLKRLAASLEIAGRDREFAKAQRRDAVGAAVRAYRTAMHDFAERTNLDVWYAHADVEQILDQYRSQLGGTGRKRVGRALAKARTRDNLGAMGRFATVEDGVARILADPPLIVPAADLYSDRVQREDLEHRIHDLLEGYRASLAPDRRALIEAYRPADIARKVVGVGSVGTRCYMVLLLGRDANDPLFLQAKEAGPSVLEPYLGAAAQKNCAERVVVGQRLMQTTGDIFLGWQRVVGMDGADRDFYLRQLRDWKASVDLEVIEPPGLVVYAQICGWTLARAHARSGDRVAIAAYLGSSGRFDRALTEFAEHYADRNEQDYAALTAAIADGRIAVEPEG
ncbi:MAG: DUF2252 domain-containing protein [Pseudonocardia sp.]